MMETNQNLFSLNIDPVTKTHLAVTARWAKFLAVLGMIVLALGLIVALMGATLFTTFFGVPTTSTDPGTETIVSTARVTMVVSALIGSAIVFFPLLYLLRFANSMRRAIAANDQKGLNTAFEHLRSHFRYLGIVAIIFLVLYGFIIAMGIMGVAN